MQLSHILKKHEDVMSTVVETSRLLSIDSLTASGRAVESLLEK